jgi:hypothetical protein
MEYQVPQFIEVEDRIVGQLTLRQFIYVGGGIGLCVVFFSYLPFIFAVLLSLPTVGFAAALAFYKVNGKPFIEVLEAGFNYYTHSKLFLWKHVTPKNESAQESTAVVEPPKRATPKLTRGKLSELAWSLDVQSPPSDRP